MERHPLSPSIALPFTSSAKLFRERTRGNGGVPHIGAFTVLQSKMRLLPASA
jgi:hypothetical protein